MKTPIKAIVFDFGGVLLDWDPRYLYKRYFNGDSRAMERFLKEIDFYHWNAQQDGGRSFEEGIREHSSRFPQYADLIQAYFDRWEDSIRGVIPGSVEILRRLKEAGYRIFGLSNWSAETYPRASHRFEFFQLFDRVFLSGELGLVKPDPAIYEYFLTGVKCTAPECVLIDDTLENIVSAKRIGFKTIHFQSPQKLAAALEQLQLLDPYGPEAKYAP